MVTKSNFVKLSDTDSNLIVRSLADTAIKKQADKNALRVELLAKIKYLKSLKASDQKGKIEKSIKATNKHLHAIGRKLEIVSINTPEMKAHLKTLGLSDNQVNMIIHRACILKAEHDKATKALNSKGMAQEIRNETTGVVKIKRKRFKRDPYQYNDQDKTVEYSSNQLNIRRAVIINIYGSKHFPNVLEDIKRGTSRKIDLIRLDTSHGTHYDQRVSAKLDKNTDNHVIIKKSMSARQKDYHTSTPLIRRFSSEKSDSI